MADAVVPQFKSHDDFCAQLQRSIRADYQELAFEFAGDKRGLRIIERRISELDKSIAALESRQIDAASK